MAERRCQMNITRLFVSGVDTVYIHAQKSPVLGNVNTATSFVWRTFLYIPNMHNNNTINMATVW